MAPDISDVSKDTQSLHGHEVIPPTGLAVRDLGKTFKGRPVLRDVNLAVQRGAVYAEHSRSLAQIAIAQGKRRRDVSMFPFVQHRIQAKLPRRQLGHGGLVEVGLTVQLHFQLRKSDLAPRKFRA